MKRFFTLIMLSATFVANAQNKPQITNSDFEDWSGVTASNNAPNNWNSFQTATGSYASMVKEQQVEQSSDVRPGSEGVSSVRIYARAVKFFGTTIAVAQGNLTTGRINAGSISATNKGNHNFSDITNEAFSEKLGVMPDSIVFWAKYNPADNNQSARFAAVVHDSYNYITYGTYKDDAADAANASHAVAKATLNFTTERDADGKAQWVRYALPFSTEGLTATSPDYILVNISTSSVPGEGNENDELFIDDVELVYCNTKKFTDNLVVTINDNSSAPMTSTIYVEEQADGKYTLSLKNFILASEDGDIAVGNIKVTDAVGTEQGDGSIKLSQTQDIVIEEGDDANVEMWMGPIICLQVGAIPVEVDAVMTNDKLNATISIDLSNSVLGQKIYVTFGDVTSGVNELRLSVDKASDSIYNLQGMRVDSSYKGIVIRNGKKYINE